MFYHRLFSSLIVTSCGVKAAEAGRSIFAGWMPKREDNFSAQIKELIPLWWYQDRQRPSTTRGLVFGRRSSQCLYDSFLGGGGEA